MGRERERERERGSYAVSLDRPNLVTKEILGVISCSDEKTYVCIANSSASAQYYAHTNAVHKYACTHKLVHTHTHLSSRDPSFERVLLAIPASGDDISQDYYITQNGR